MFDETVATQAMASAFTFETSPDWEVNLDNTIQYTMGWRMEGIDPRIANHPFFA